MRLLHILRFWLPLFVSWLLMTSEGPVLTAAINRLSEPILNLAAVGIVFAVAVAIESPIIQLLATATALVGDRSAFFVVRRFTIQWMLALTAAHAAIAMTPVFDLVVAGWMGTPEPLLAPVRLGLSIMVPWSAAIAWRRFLQGVLIRAGRPQLVAWGTAVRLLASCGGAIGLALGTSLPGVAIGSLGLAAGVVAEAVYASVVSRGVRRALPSATNEPLSATDLWRFHLPLAATSVLALVVQPLITATLARLALPQRSLAAWPVVFHLTLLLRAPAFALPEAVISLSAQPGSAAPLRRFSGLLAFSALVAMALFVATPLSQLYLDRVQNLTNDVAALADGALLLLLPFPAISTTIAWRRGTLIARRHTGEVNLGMTINLLVTALILGVALVADAPGLASAAVALTVAALVELAFLALRATNETAAAEMIDATPGHSA